MDIRGWPMDRIMQLPDCFFGRRFSISAQGLSDDAAMAYDISELALPERSVLWEVALATDEPGLAGTFGSLRVALGDQLPTNLAMMDALEPLVPGWGIQGPEPRYIGAISRVSSFHMRNPISAQGRRLVVEVISSVGATVRVQVICEISSMPTEVPDWLCSGNLRSP